MTPVPWAPDTDHAARHVVWDVFANHVRNRSGYVMSHGGYKHGDWKPLEEKILESGFTQHLGWEDWSRAHGATPPRTDRSGESHLYEYVGNAILVLITDKDPDGDYHMVVRYFRQSGPNLWPQISQWIADIPDPVVAVSNTVPVTFSFMTPQGPTSNRRHIAAPKWTDIERNYTQKVMPALSGLSDVNLQGHESEDPGRIVLLHGDPGTGKSTYLRSLARSWLSWCEFTYVVDPDILFERSDYLYQLATSSDGARWTALVLEDVDEFIAEHSKAKVGQAYSRLLNLADGFLGQGLKIILVMTTNIEVAKVSPALIRPGRRLAEIHVPRMTVDEVTAWLGTKPPTEASSLTLADLYEHQKQEIKLVNKDSVDAPGLYL